MVAAKILVFPDDRVKPAEQREDSAKVLPFQLREYCLVCGCRATYSVNYFDMYFNFRREAFCNDAPWCYAVDNKKQK